MKRYSCQRFHGDAKVIPNHTLCPPNEINVRLQLKINQLINKLLGCQYCGNIHLNAVL